MGATAPSSLEPVDRSRWIIARCREFGFALAGVCDAAPTEHAEDLRQWLADGKHGEMEYLSEYLPARLDPGLVLQGARSAVMVADLYRSRDEDDPGVPEGAGRIARYARGRDYHDVIKARLHELCDRLREAFPEASFRAFTDTAPVSERELAVRAGLGWTGKHTLAIHPKAGSWMLLGGVLTTLELPVPPEQEQHADHCGTCTRCIDACPTDAIEPWTVDARRCISYLTIEHRSLIDEPLHEGMGDWIAGCDVCQEVCPHNSARDSTPFESHESYRPLRTGFDLLSVLGWDEAARREAVRGSALRRIKLDMFRRNALIAAGNIGRESLAAALLERIAEIAGDAGESAMVRETARAVLRRLDRRSGTS
ncbi:MAG: tRNA epoxyqueuosine(34) reductase QueG [Phycisphaerales bacterium]